MEVARRFANRADLLEVFERVRERCGTGTGEPASTVRSDRPADYNPRRRLLSERFNSHELQQIIDMYRRGARICDVAKRYEIGTTTLKKLLREHGARRCDN